VRGQARREGWIWARARKERGDYDRAIRDRTQQISKGVKGIRECRAEGREVANSGRGGTQKREKKISVRQKGTRNAVKGGTLFTKCREEKAPPARAEVFFQEIPLFKRLAQGLHDTGRIEEQRTGGLLG